MLWSLLAIGPLRIDRGFGGDIELTHRIGMGRVEGRHLGKVLRDRQFGLADTFHDAFGQLVAAVVVVMSGVLSRESEVRISRAEGLIKQLNLLMALRSMSATFSSLAVWRTASG